MFMHKAWIEPITKNRMIYAENNCNLLWGYFDDNKRKEMAVIGALGKEIEDDGKVTHLRRSHCLSTLQIIEFKGVDLGLLGCI